MKKYETLFAIRPDMTEEEITAIIERIQNVIKNNGGNVEEVEEWGMRKLAYKIKNKYRDGYYTLINFEAEKSCLDELNHTFRITEDILRDIIVKRY